jgi:transcriptional regulator with XRE-family HTH domain
MTTKKQTPIHRQARYPYYGLGFKVDLIDVPLMEIDGEWVPDVNYNVIEDYVGFLVGLKPAPLTGAEVRFLRRHVGMTLDDLAARLGVTRQGAIKWEKSGDHPTKMGLATEKLFRMIVLDRKGVSAGFFKKAFEALQAPRRSTPSAYEIPARPSRTPQHSLDSILKLHLL